MNINQEQFYTMNALQQMLKVIVERCIGIDGKFVDGKEMARNEVTSIKLMAKQMIKELPYE